MNKCLTNQSRQSKLIVTIGSRPFRVSLASAINFYDDLSVEKVTWNVLSYQIVQWYYVLLPGKKVLRISTGGNNVIHLFICSKGCDSYYPICKQRQTALVEIGRSICRSREGRWLICITLRNLVRRVWKRKKRNFSLVLTQKLLSGFKKNLQFFFRSGHQNVLPWQNGSI